VLGREQIEMPIVSRSFAILAALGAVPLILTATAESIAQPGRFPREPLEPGARTRQYPAGLARSFSIPPNSISVSNFGNAKLGFSASDGKSKWRQFSLAPSETVAVSCAECREAVSIAFNDGAVDRVVPVKLGARYALYWLKSAGRWDLASFQALEESGALSK
jgi:hypothetical protein